MPHPVDTHVGNKLRHARAKKGISQQQLGEALQISFQQIQKYERAANRIAVSRPWDISKALNLDVDYFFEDLKDKTTFDPGAVPKQTIQLASQIDAIADDTLKTHIVNLIRTCASRSCLLNPVSIIDS